MEIEKQAQLAQMLYRATMSGKLQWRETSRQESVQTTINKYVIQIERRPREGGEYDFIINVINKAGDTIDTFDDNSIKANSEYTEMYSNYMILWSKIKRTLSGADAALDDILKDLGDMG